MYSCETVRSELSNLVDGDLAERLRREVDHHLAECRACRALYDSTRKTLTIVSEAGGYELTESVSERLMRSIRDRVARGETAADLPPTEETRLEALRRYGILDTPAESDFDDLVLLASQICGTPIAAVSIVDRDRQWFKARVGLDAAETPREVAFCAHAILGKDLMVVPDAWLDKRFEENPLVTEEPRIRFYAGAPLITRDGVPLGTLCVIDRVPRQLTPEQERALVALSREVVAQLELRKVNATLEQTLTRRLATEEALRSSEEFKTRMIECSRDCIKVLDLEGRLLSMNAGGMEALEICDLAPFLNNSWIDFWKGKDLEMARGAVAAAAAGSVGRFVGYFETVQTRSPRWFDVVVSPILSDERRPQQLLAVSRDITSHKRVEDLFRTLTQATATTTGTEFFRALVRTVATALSARYAFVTECLEGSGSVRMLAFWKTDGYSENLEYGLAGTPCQAVIEGEMRCYPDRLAARFPQDTGLLEWQAESFLGLPLRGRSGAVIGHLAVIDDGPMQESSLEASVLQVFADRAAAELERLRASSELEALKDRLQAENVYLQEEIRSQHNFEEIIGNSPALLAALARVERVAQTDSAVLIQGETGTGKELFARAIHSRSARRQRPLVKVNCGAIPAGLVESELFGHARGAFTGALEKRIGRFELADGGTIFLDEVGEMPLDTQVKLLRVLQEQEFEPVGSSRTVRVDVRVIAASNRDLERAAQEGRFRADLLYRLNVVPVAIPPLRDREGDIPLLVGFFAAGLSKRLGKPIEGFSRRGMEQLRAYSWPGNVRELQNVVERAAILSAGPVLELESDLASPERESSALAAAPRSLAEVEKAHILDALQATGGVVEGPNGAARILGLNANTLRSRLKKLAVNPRRETS
ncbi:MAG TPA: sigma 54-interacting transcriptional regulator [Thermoanaerobaculia bacterium]